MSMILLTVQLALGQPAHSQVPVNNFPVNQYSPTTQAVLAWGRNGFGSEPYRIGWLGDGTNINRSLPVDITNQGVLAGKTVVQVVSNEERNLALCSDGTVAAWGAPGFGGLGNTPAVASRIPVDITHSGALNGKRATQVSLGEDHSLVLCSDGTVVAWGRNLYGEVGDGTTYQRLSPVAVDTSGVLNGKTVIQVAAGDGTSLLLCSDGTVVSWGAVNHGAVGDGSNATQILPVDITNKGYLQGKTVTQICCGFTYCFALCSDGTVASWGSNLYYGWDSTGQWLNKVPANMSSNTILSGKFVTQVVAGESHVLFLCSDGTLAAGGSNVYGQLGNGTKTEHRLPVAINNQGILKNKKIVDIAAGANHSIALCSDGTVATWGRDYDGELGDGSPQFEGQPIPLSITNKGALSGKRAYDVETGGYHNIVLAARVGASSAITGSATDITSSSATLNAMLNPNGAETTAIFEYGLTSDYGSQRSITVPLSSGIFDQPISAPITGLAPSTTYHFRVSASNRFGTTVGQDGTFTTLPDSSKPIPTVGLPLPGQKVLLSNFKAGSLAGTASDDFGVTGVAVRISRLREGVVQTWNGSEFTSASAGVAATLSGNGPSVAWSLDNVPSAAQLDEGQYIVVVYASDAAGNTGTTTARFTLVASDSEVPTVGISRPTLNQKILIGEFGAGAIAGVATDNLGVTSVKVKLSRKRGTSNFTWNGTAFTTASVFLQATLTPAGTGQVKWTLDGQLPTATDLDAGAYKLEAFAIDVAGNKSATAAQPFTLGTDFTAPTVAIVAPTASQKLSIGTFGSGTLNGIASDNLGVTSVKVKLLRKRGTVTTYWNGTAFTTATATVEADLTPTQGNNITWSLTNVPNTTQGLDAGSYTLYASAYDAAGNTTSSASRSFTLTVPANVPGNVAASNSSS